MFTIVKKIPCRRNVETLQNQEKIDLIAAIKAIKSDGIYDTFTLMHVTAMSTPTPSDVSSTVRNVAHRGPAFTPWHREFLIRLELELRKKTDTLAIPYWDWANNQDPTTAAVWATDMLGGDGDSADGDIVKTGPFREGEWETINTSGNNAGALKRNFSGSLPTQDNIDTVQALTVYDTSPWDTTSANSYRNQLEGWDGPNLHNAVHVWVGGDMGPSTSPNDPVFYFHHCMVDKLWADWQQLHPASQYLPQSGGPSGHNATDALAPWSTRPNDVLDHFDFYMYDTDEPIIELVSPSIAFQDIPEGETTYRAVVFNVTTCETLNFEILPGLGADFGTLTNAESIDPGREAIIGEMRLWISYTGTTDGDSTSDSVTIRETNTGEEWTLNITANTVSRPTAAVVLALDKSGSMNDPSGITGQNRIDVLRYSAAPFANLIQEGNAIGIISFDHDAYDVMPITGPLGPASAFDMDRANAVGFITTHQVNPAGLTAIGDALEKAQSLLTPASYDVKAVVVLTDGHETAAKYISEVSGSINSRVYAIGLGTPEQIEPATLSLIADGTDGYMYVTGELNDDLYFRLTKYFLQILAGITNQDIVTDPQAWLASRQTHKIPFDLSESDISADVILLAVDPSIFKFSLETPDGDIIDPSMAPASPAINFVNGTRCAYYRITLPVPVGASGAREGKWHVVLQLDDKAYLRYVNSLDNSPEAMALAKAHGALYSVNVHAYSNLRMKATLTQTSYEPGADVYLNVVMTEYGMPMLGNSTLTAEIIRPNNTQTTIHLTKIEDGIYETSFVATLTGVYTCRIMAAGKTLRGRDYTREQTLTASVWKGGDTPTNPRDSGNHGDPNDGGGIIKFLENCCKKITVLLVIGILILIFIAVLLFRMG